MKLQNSSHLLISKRDLKEIVKGQYLIEKTSELLQDKLLQTCVKGRDKLWPKSEVCKDLNQEKINEFLCRENIFKQKKFQMPASRNITEFKGHKLQEINPLRYFKRKIFKD